MTRLLSPWLLLLTLILFAEAKEPTWPLEGKNTASGTFRQTVTDINGGLAFSSMGRFAALKPAHFRWEIESPDRQVLVVTPEGFWQWDKGLDVVILRDAPDLADLPISAIWRGTLSESSSGAVETGLFGRSVNNLSVRSLDENTIVVLFEDALGQKIRFEFILERQGIGLPSAFEMSVPEGVDFYDESSRSLGRSGAIE